MHWGKLKPDDQARLGAVFRRVKDASLHLIGYPCNQTFDYSELTPFLGFHTNNLGDPFADTNFGPNTHDIEREVIEEYARLTEAPLGDFWGYVTNGGTEGNLYGLYLARELHPEGIVYYSEDTHYSVAKSLRVLGSRSIMIRSQEHGEIDYDDLLESLRIHRDSPAILFLNEGTTMKGAHDDVSRVREILRELRIQRSYIHVDAALSGMILPYVKNPGHWNFKSGADSISTSGHKMIGSPLPSGMVLARKSNVDRIARSVEYVGVLDTTLSGSRNAYCPLVLWYAMKRLGFEGMKELVHSCFETADYALARLREADIPAWRNENSIIVVFPRPSDQVVHKWQIAPQGKIGHLVTMPHVSRHMIDSFVSDYLDKLPSSSTHSSPPAPGSRLQLPRKNGSMNR